MKKKPNKLLFKGVSQLCIGIFCQLLLAVQCLAHVSLGQNAKSVHDVTIETEYKNATLADVFADIESKTDYVFTYDKKDAFLRDRYSREAGKATVAEVLESISQKSRLIFQQINNNISVGRQTKNGKTIPSVTVTAAFNVSGTVTSQADGEGLPGVNVIVKGSTIGTVTDINGQYTLSVPDENGILVFSSIGFELQEIPINGRSVIDVILAEDIQSLEEIVVVGYGIQEKKEITSAVSSVKAEDFNNGNVNDVAQLLQGKVAGMVISKPGGNPNQGFSIRLRGLSTLGQNQQPLVVIDGIIGADLNSVDPTDIASIDVLKDGSASAIYGTRGSSGVILITTKTGKPGKPVVDYNGYVAADQVARSVQVMNRDQFLEAGGEDLGANTNWVDEITRTGISHVHNLAVGGGSQNTTYRVSLNYRDIKGIALNTGFDQLNGRINLTQKALKDKLALTFNLASTVRNQSFGFDQVFQNASLMNPTAPIRSDDPAYDQYGGYYQRFLSQNPVAFIEQNVNDGQLKRLNFNFQGDYEIFPGLSLMARYSRNNEDEIQGEYLSKYSFGTGSDRNGLATSRSLSRVNELFESTLTYRKDLEKLNITVLGGSSFQHFYQQSSRMQGGNFITDEFQYHNMAASLDFPDGRGTVESNKNSYTLVAPAFGRLNLNYDNTYFFTASARYEGSSRFGANNKWGLFPALSAGVNLANLVNIPQMDDLKARISYGVTGAIPGESYLSYLRFGPQTSYFLLNGEYVPVYAPVSNPNPDLKWETKAEINAGLDFSFLESRLNGSIDVYTRTTKDLIIELPVAVPPNLYPTSILNVGELQNSGFELAVNYKAVNTANFTWTPAFNFTTFTTKLISLSTSDIDYGTRDIAFMGAPGQSGTPLIRVEEGKPLGQIWGIVYDGIGEDGKWKHKDLNGDGEITNEDRQVLGNGYPSIELGFNNSFTYRNFDLNFFFRGALGHDLVNTYRAFYEVKSVTGSYNAVRTKYYNPDLTDQGAFSSIHVEDASFIKLDNAQIGYTINVGPEKMISRLRLYVSGQNLFFITNYTGVDPEVRFVDSAENNNPLAPGIDRTNTWFRTRTYTFGLNLSF